MARHDEVAKHKALLARVDECVGESGLDTGRVLRVFCELSHRYMPSASGVVVLFLDESGEVGLGLPSCPRANEWLRQHHGEFSPRPPILDS